MIIPIYFLVKYRVCYEYGISTGRIMRGFRNLFGGSHMFNTQTIPDAERLTLKVNWLNFNGLKLKMG